MRTFKVYAELQKFINRCGGEDTIRWIAKTVGSKNWKTTKIHPIVAWNESYATNPVLVGIAVRVNGTYQIIASIENKNDINFRKWIDEVSNGERYFDVASGLLNIKNAIIASETDIIDGEILGWKHIIREVMDGKRSNGLEENKNDINKTEHEIDVQEFNELINYFEGGNIINNFIKLLEDSLKNIDVAVINLDSEGNSEDFDDNFKEEWA